MTMKNGIHDAVAKLLTAKLEVYKNKSLDHQICSEIYVSIFETLAELFESSKTPLDNEAVNYIAQQYYDGILVGGVHELDPNIFDKRAKLENIPTKELALMAVLLMETDFKFPILEEIKKRQ